MPQEVSSIRINTKLKTDGIKKDRKAVENELKQLNKSAESIGIEKSIEKYNAEITKSKAKTAELVKEQKRLNQEMAKAREVKRSEVRSDVVHQNTAEKAVNSLSATLPKGMSDEEMDIAKAKEYSRVMDEITEKALTEDKAFSKQASKLDDVNSKIQTQKTLQAETTAKIENKKIELAQALEKEKEYRSTLNGEIRNLDEKARKQEQFVIKQKEALAKTKAAKKAAEEHNRSIKRGIRHVSKLAIAVLGARAAYSMVRRAVNYVLEDNEQLKNTIDAIWAGMGSAFEPVINSMIQGFATALSYAFEILRVLTGINILGKANEKLKKKKKGSGSKGDLASFDSSEVLKKGSGSGDPTDHFIKPVQLSEKLLKILERIKALFAQIGKIGKNLATNMKKAWEDAGNGLRIMQSLENIFDRIFSCLENIVEATVIWSETINFSPLLLGIATLLESIEPLIDIICDGFEYLWENLLLPFATFTIESGLPLFLELLAASLEVLGSIVEGIMPGLEWLWENFFSPIASFVGDAFIEFMTLLIELLTSIGDWISDNSDAIENLTVLVGLLATAFGAWHMATFLLNSVLAPLVGFIVGLINPFTIILGLIALIITEFGDWGAVIEDFKLILSGLTKFISGVFTGEWKKAWLGVQQIFAGVWNGILDIVQAVINGVVTGINAVIDALNSLSFTIPEWVPFWGGNTFGLGLSHVSGYDVTQFKWIPKLAQGAVIPPNKPFMAMLGDQSAGRNLEAPEGLIRQIIQEEMGSGGGGSTIVIKADAEIGALIRLLHLKLDEEDNRSGQTLVLETEG